MHAQAVEDLQSVEHVGDAALHVGAASSVETTVADVGCERVARPQLERFGGDGIDVAVEQQAAPAAATGQTGRELRSAAKIEIVGHVRIALAGRFRLP